MQQSEQLNELAAALAKAQSAIVNPPKNKTVTVVSDKGRYTFDYATLDAIFEAIRGPLADNGLSFIQAMSGESGKMKLTTRLLHISGQWIETETPVEISGKGMQAIGSAQTYARRYAISSLLGIVADEDDDANTADGNGLEAKNDRAPAKKATPEQESEPWKDMAETIKKSIDDAKDAKELDGVMKNAAGHLETIKAKSETAYSFLMDRSLKKKSVFAQEPPAKKVA